MPGKACVHACASSAPASAPPTNVLILYRTALVRRYPVHRTTSHHLACTCPVPTYPVLSRPLPVSNTTRHHTPSHDIPSPSIPTTSLSTLCGFWAPSVAGPLPNDSSCRLGYLEVSFFPPRCIFPTYADDISHKRPPPARPLVRRLRDDRLPLCELFPPRTALRKRQHPRLSTDTGLNS